MKIEIDALCKFTAKADAVMENQSYYCSMAEKEIARGVKKAYAAVVGQDDYVVLVTYDDHFGKNALERGFVFADDAVQVIIQYLENNYTLADMILEAEDVGYKKNKSHGTVAIHFQKEDWFLYLCVKDGFIHISTLVSAWVYYVNPDSDLVVTVAPDGKTLYRGFEGNRRFVISKGSKYKGGNGH